MFFSVLMVSNRLACRRWMCFRILPFDFVDARNCGPSGPQMLHLSNEILLVHSSFRFVDKKHKRHTHLTTSVSLSLSTISKYWPSYMVLVGLLAAGDLDTELNVLICGAFFFSSFFTAISILYKMCEGHREMHFRTSLESPGSQTNTENTTEGTEAGPFENKQCLSSQFTCKWYENHFQLSIVIRRNVWCFGLHITAGNTKIFNEAGNSAR